jgi:toxin-antitoxin system PIN domain toxin
VFVVDTNILIYAANRWSPFHLKCHAAITGWLAQPEAWHLTWGICYEFLSAVTQRRTFEPPWSAEGAWSFLARIFEARSLEMLVPTDRHAAVLAAMIEDMPHVAGNLLHDVETVTLMREHGVRTIYTRDMDFHRFAGIEVIDPAT